MAVTAGDSYPQKVGKRRRARLGRHDIKTQRQVTRVQLAIGSNQQELARKRQHLASIRIVPVVVETIVLALLSALFVARGWTIVAAVTSFSSVACGVVALIRRDDRQRQTAMTADYERAIAGSERYLADYLAKRATSRERIELP